MKTQQAFNDSNTDSSFTLADLNLFLIHKIFFWQLKKRNTWDISQNISFIYPIFTNHEEYVTSVHYTFHKDINP